MPKFKKNPNPIRYKKTSGFKMKAGKEGPMRKNFPSAFKHEDERSHKHVGDNVVWDQYHTPENVTETTTGHIDSIGEGLDNLLTSEEIKAQTQGRGQMQAVVSKRKGDRTLDTQISYE